NKRSAPNRVRSVSYSRSRAGAHAIPSWLARMRRAAKSLMRSRDRLWFQTGVGGEANEKLLVSDHIFKHRNVECRILRRASQVMGTKPCHIEESMEPLRVGAEEGQCRDRHRSAEIGLCGLQR